MFDINKFRNINPPSNRYDKQLDRLKKQAVNTSFIEKAIREASQNLASNIKSFVIYGEPQSGKTEMMICLTAKLLDEGQKIIIVLLNDNVELLKQNLNRFRGSGIDPDPKNFSEIIDPDLKIGENDWIIFSKKNAKDLRRIIDKLSSAKRRVIIDDEADYATPNSKINKGEKTRINALIGELLGKDGIYIGVTATPARLDLNNTFENANDKWVHFPAHAIYTGPDVFFPINLNSGMKFRLCLLPDSGDDPKYLREALFRFFTTVAFLNLTKNVEEKHYSMLVHTSGKRVDHSDDYKHVIKVLNSLNDKKDKNFEVYLKDIWEIASQRFGQDLADKITSYICANIARYTIVLMNSSTDKKNVDYTTATVPTAPFTIAIGGNIVSRGVTFKDLLSMFFTRDVKHKIQQDTYIQRARMFGSRNDYVEYFELAIPESLYLDWHRCFVFHRLALESIKSGQGCPVWLEDHRVAAVSSSSIDKSTVAMDSGEMSYAIFDYMPEIEEIINKSVKKEMTRFETLKKLSELLGPLVVPDYVISYIENFSPKGEQSLVIHNSSSISGQKSEGTDQANVRRAKGFMGSTQIEQDKYPDAIHHIKIFFNDKNKARIFYKYAGNIKFIKNWKTYQHDK